MNAAFSVKNGETGTSLWKHTTRKLVWYAVKVLRLWKRTIYVATTKQNITRHIQMFLESCGLRNLNINLPGLGIPVVTSGPPWIKFGDAWIRSKKWSDFACWPSDCSKRSWKMRIYFNCSSHRGGTVANASALWSSEHLFEWHWSYLRESRAYASHHLA